MHKVGLINSGKIGRITMGKPHKHADMIEYFVGGGDVEYRKKNTTGSLADEDTFRPVLILGTFDSSLYFEFRIKPAREYPKTNLTDQELSDIFCQYDSKLISVHGAGIAAVFAVANAAIRRYIDDKENEE
jgi:hypothetical protein